MKEPTLVVLAAGMGSRYGGLKQIDPVGPSGETIMDYSLYDACRAGFRRVVFVIKEEMEEAFRRAVVSRVEGHMETVCVFQRLDDLPAGISLPQGRVKPWGTCHALLSAREVLDGPFMVVNADDYYGPDAFARIYGFLTCPNTGPLDCAMVGYLLKNTVTENGSVARGVCKLDETGNLAEITERTRIEIRPFGIAFSEDGGESWTPLPGDTLVSMNCWGFPQAFLAETAARFPAALDAGLAEKPLTWEYYLPEAVEELLKDGAAIVRMLTSPDKWYGVTYRADRESVAAAMAEKAEAGLYPNPLWG